MFHWMCVKPSDVIFVLSLYQYQRRSYCGAFPACCDELCRSLGQLQSVCSEKCRAHSQKTKHTETKFHGGHRYRRYKCLHRDGGNRCVFAGLFKNIDSDVNIFFFFFVCEHFFNVFVISLVCWAHMFLARRCLVAEPRRSDRHRSFRKHRRQHFENPPTSQPKSMCHICWLIRRMNKQDNPLFLCVIKCTLCQLLFCFCLFFSSGALRNGNTHCEPWTFLCTLYDWTQDRPKVEQKDHRILLRGE